MWDKFGSVNVITIIVNSSEGIVSKVFRIWLSIVEWRLCVVSVKVFSIRL